jgi:hypothetical protein
MVKILKPSKVLRPKKERDWLMACALMGTHKTIRAMRSLGLTFPQLEFLARRIAKPRVVFLDSAQQLKLPRGSRRPQVKGGVYSGRLVTSLDEKRMNEVEGFAWINQVLPWAYDPLGLSVYQQSKQWPNVGKANAHEAEVIAGIILAPLEVRLSGERTKKVKKSDKGRRAATDWIMNASKFEILSDDKANEYRWKKLRHVKALSVCSHLAWQVSVGLRKSFTRRYSADVRKYLEPKDDILNVFARTRAIENMKPRFLRWWQAICISDSLSPPALFRHRTTFPRDTVLFIIARRVQGN